MTNRFWTEEMKYFLIAHWHKGVSGSWIAKQFRKTPEAIRRYACVEMALGPKRPKEDYQVAWVPPPEPIPEMSEAFVEAMSDIAVDIEWTPGEARRLEEVR